MMIPNVLGQTPGFNGYGVTLEDKPQAQPKKKRGPVMNALSAAFEFGAPEAFEAGRQKRLRKDLSNAFKQNDLSGASNLLFDMGQYDAGLGLRDQMQAQRTSSQNEQLRMAYESTKLLSQEPDTMRRFQMAQQMSQQLGLPAPTDPAEFTDDQIQQALDTMRIKGGFEEAGGDQFTLSQGQVRYDANGNVVADNPEIAGSDEPWYITEDGVDPRYIEAQQAGGAPGGPRVQSAFTGQDNQRYAIMSDGSVKPLGVNERNPFQIVDFGGLPTAVDRITGERQELSSIDEVASNEAVTTEATETAKQNVTAKAEDRQARIGFARRANNQIPKIESALKAVEDAIETSNARNTGAVQLPFSGVQALGGLLTTLEANLAFNELGDMRRNSPTGGALGNVSEGELTLLGSTIANLNQGQSEGRLDKNLKTVEASLNRLLSALREDAAYTVEGSTLTPELQAIDDEIARLEEELGL